MTSDEEWVLLGEFVRAHNVQDFALIESLTQTHHEQMTPYHWDTLLDAVCLTTDFCAKHREFLGQVLHWLREYNPQLSFRTSLRAGILQTLIHP